jgi:hypothetical protein
VTFRPKWSTFFDGTPAWQRCVRVSLAAALIGSCSDLDPNVGPRRTEQPLVDGGATTGSGNAGNCVHVTADEVCFARDIRPLMNRASKGDPTGKGCKGCHYSTEAQHIGLDLSSLDLATLGSLRKGGGSSLSRIIVAGRPKDSAIVQALHGTYPYANQMPKNGPFWKDDTEISLVERWIAEGAKGADDE